MKMENHNTPEAVEAAATPTDCELLVELLDDLDAITGMIERTRAAVTKGRADVRLIPRGKALPIAGALDQLGDALTRRTLQVRAQRALRDGQTDDALSAALRQVEI